MRQFRSERVYVKRPERGEKVAKTLLDAIDQSQTYTQLMKALKKKVLLRAVKAEGGNLCRASNRLGVHRNTVNRAMREVGLSSVQVREYLRSEA
jgi:transcriptional regulator of acetoin/glycerol metabolism